MTQNLEVPDGATYGQYDITEIGFNPDLETVYVIFEGNDLLDGWEQLIFPVEGSYPSNLEVTEIPVGLVPPVECQGNNSLGAKTSENLYELLREIGIEVSGDLSNRV